MKPKLPTKWALMLADLHNKVMELQDEFDTLRQDCYCGELPEEAEGYDPDELEEELEAICDQLDTIEAETSELDCEYNDYGY